ncbi:MAG: ADP-dependent glucokinase/phosphofructokinase [Candidatus Nanohalobium sp.]
MKDRWLRMYGKAAEKEDFNSEILLGFNANIDISTRFKDTDIDLEDVKPEEMRKISSFEDLKKVLKYVRDCDTNIEVDSRSFDPEIDGEEQIGGQAGIMSNFLTGLGHTSVIYTPFLSTELAEKLDEKVLYPEVEDSLKLKRTEDAVNSDRTKKNYIIEFEEESRRLILSDSLRGFGPYFRKGVEDRFSQLQEEIDRAILSGFHDAEGNFKSKIRKAEKQLRKLHIPKHLEFVSSSQDRDKAIMEELLPYFTSVGLDSSELVKAADIMGEEVEDEPSLGEAYSVSKKLIEEYGVKRVHVHTKEFQSVVTDGDYGVRDKKMRESLLYAGIAAASMAETGGIPEKEDVELERENMHVRKLDELEHFEDFFGLEDFTETGIARPEGYKVVAVPTLIHEEPKRLVGMGDIISSGAFTAEIN